MQVIHPLSEEANVIKPQFYNRKNSEKKDYLNLKFYKPWGFEYLTYQTDKIGIWVLHVNKNQKTSLHCHFKKDSMLIALSGTFRIDTYNDFHILTENQIIYFPANSFHGIMSYSDTGIILEIEIYSSEISYSDKNDLLRLRDIYNRDKNTYEGSVTETIVPEDESVNFHNRKDFVFGTDCNIHIRKFSKDKPSIVNKLSPGTINILLDGVIVANNILAPGSIVNTDYKLVDTECTILEIDNMYFSENSKIIYSKEHLTDLIAKNRFQNIGLTSGCFDILHKGHIHNLKMSKSKCSILFVCLSSDKQISELKGDSRPINNITDRIRMLSHINFIDYIILYDEIDNTNEKELDNIMNLLEPEYWFKGSDYDEIAIRSKHPTLKNICLLENVTNVSTTIIISRIK
jgi:rfaE bifunctional protein nucleotidyltransferase chain/domain